jgi:hypothetical protein
MALDYTTSEGVRELSIPTVIALSQEIRLDLSHGSSFFPSLYHMQVNLPPLILRYKPKS